MQCKLESASQCFPTVDCQIVLGVEIRACLNALAGKNANGVTLLRAISRLSFVCNHEIPHRDIQSYHSKHYVNDEQYQTLVDSWKRKAEFCVAWEFKVGTWYDEPIYFPYGGESSISFSRSMCGIFAFVSYLRSKANRRGVQSYTISENMESSIFWHLTLHLRSAVLGAIGSHAQLTLMLTRSSNVLKMSGKYSIAMKVIKCCSP